MRIGRFMTLIILFVSAIPALNVIQHNARAQTSFGSIGLPAYDSGWTPIARDQEITFTHGLGTTELLVYVTNNQASNGINQRDYGSYSCTYSGVDSGVYWRTLTPTTIIVYRSQDDYTADSVRVMLWEIRETSPPMNEVSSTEFLMILGLTVAILYSVYSKAKPRFRRQNKINQKTLLDYTR